MKIFNKSHRHNPLFVFCLLFVVIFILTSSPVFSLVNTERYRMSDDKLGLGGNLDISFSWYKGNTDLLAIDSEVGLYYNFKKSQYFLRGILKYGEKAESTYINMGFLHLRGMFDLGSNLMLELFAQEEFNKFILLNERTLAGTGLRWAPMDSPKEKKNKFAIYLGSGVMWEAEHYAAAEDGSQKENTSLVKSTNYLSLNYNTPVTELGVVTYIQFSLNEIEAFRVFTDLIIAFKISSRLSFKTKVNFRYDNRPPVTIEKTDIQVTNGLSLEF